MLPSRLNLNLFLLPLLPLTAMAQTPTSSWETVKMLTPGTQIRISVGTSRKPISGTLESVTDADLGLTQESGKQSFTRAQVISVSIKKRDHRLRNALIGLGVGTAGGLLIGFGVGHAQASGCRTSGGWFCTLDEGVGTAVGGVGGLVGGTLLGVFWPTGGWSKIYGQ